LWLTLRLLDFGAEQIVQGDDATDGAVVVHHDHKSGGGVAVAVLPWD